MATTSNASLVNAEKDMDSKEKQRAKQVIYEIIRQAGGEFHNKTNMYKAFWKAHLEYAKNNPGYLSLWPIVRMPKGPGIDKFDQLIGELVTDGLLEIDEVQNGDFFGFFFSTTEKEPSFPQLSQPEMDAIRFGVEFVSNKSATLVSEESHEQSRSWRASKNGEELNIYLDLLSDEEYEEKINKAKNLAKVFNDS